MQHHCNKCKSVENVSWHYCKVTTIWGGSLKTFVVAKPVWLVHWNGNVFILMKFSSLAALEVVIFWNGNVFILMKFSSLAALKVVKMTTSSAASDENFIKMKTFPFQCNVALHFNVSAFVAGVLHNYALVSQWSENLLWHIFHSAVALHSLGFVCFIACIARLSLWFRWHLQRYRCNFAHCCRIAFIALSC